MLSASIAVTEFVSFRAASGVRLSKSIEGSRVVRGTRGPQLGEDAGGVE